jgi:hypothetical protein
MLQQATKVQEERQERSAVMLEVLDNFAALLLLPEDVTVTCDMCGQEAFIFQEEGNFCLNCWQERTEPRI